MDDPHMILSVDGYADCVPHNPMVRKRLGPHWIDFKHRRLYTGRFGHSAVFQYLLANSERREQYEERDTNYQITFRLHAVLLNSQAFGMLFSLPCVLVKDSFRYGGRIICAAMSHRPETPRRPICCDNLLHS